MKLYWNILIAFVCLSLGLSDDLFSEKFSSRQVHNENVYVHTDRDLYIAGEHLQFKAYLLNDNNEENLKSKFIYLALRNDDNVVERVIMQLDRSCSRGSIYLHDTLSTGYYELVAHTNRMRNRGEDVFFRKPVLIVNRFDENPEMLLEDSVDPDAPELIFAPESGSFVEGIDNTLLIKTSGDFDAALRDVWVLSKSNDTIERIDTVAHTILNVHGFATVSMVPDSGYAYYAAVDGTDKLYELPEARKSGLALKVNEENNKLKVEIIPAAESPVIDRLKIMHKDNLVFDEIVYEKPFSTIIDLKELNIPKGLLFIEAEGRGWGTVAKRPWYNDYNGNSKITLETDKNQYGKREKVRLTLDGTLLEDDNAILSVSVVKPGMINKQNVSFEGYNRALELTKVSGFNHKEAVSLFGKMDVEELNEYLIINNADQDNVNHDKQNFSQNYLIENERLIISGRVVDGKTNVPLQETRIILNKPDTIINVLYTQTDDMGRFHFALSDYFYYDRLYFFVDAQNDEKEPVIEISDKFSYETPFENGRFALLRDKMDFIKRSQDIVRVNKAYGINHVEELIKEAKPVSYPPVIFSEANRTIYTDNYAPLDSLHEISREIVYGWQLRGRAGSYVSRLICGTERKWLPGSPVYFLDGIITYDIDKLTHLDSKKIYKLQIHNYQWYHGEMFFPGIIGIFTRNYEYLTALAHRTRTSMIKETLKKPTEYVTPEYGQRNGDGFQRPDLRQVLYWGADIDIEKGRSKTLSFYSGDLTGEYLIKIQGITSGGTPVSISEIINIK